MNGYLWHKGRANWKKRADREEEPKRPDPKPSELRMDRKTTKERKTEPPTVAEVPEELYVGVEG